MYTREKESGEPRKGREVNGDMRRRIIIA